MKIGDYVRTKSNGIQKIDDEGRIDLGLIKPPFHVIAEEELLKSSPNIIDLIKVGDYVNGEEIIEVIIDKEMSRVKSIDGTYFNNDIKSIVTHEQFEQMEYKL